MPEPDDTSGRRRLTRPECDQLLELPLPGIFSTIADEGWIHSVPVHFLPHDGGLRFIAERDSVKCRNVESSHRATLCVAATVGSERRYVTVEGPVDIEDHVSRTDLSALDRRYARESADPEDEVYDGSVTLVLRPERWIAWADFDD
jgi:Pyridoxamine 5'-phosphate oxidase